MKGKYPVQLFWLGFIANVLFRFMYLTLPGIILLIIGIWVFPCLVAGAVLLAVSIIVSLTEQLMIKKAAETVSDNEEFEAFRKNVTESDNWEDGVKQFVDERTNKTE